jgi:hypothetical protein
MVNFWISSIESLFSSMKSLDMPRYSRGGFLILSVVPASARRQASL